MSVLLLVELWYARALLEGVQGITDGIARSLGIAQQHVGVLLEEDRVFEIRVSAAHGTLAEDNLAGAPDLMQISKNIFSTQ